MTKAEFRTRWESDDEGGGITYSEIADCAKAWGLSPAPRTRQIDTVLYAVLKAAGTNDAEEYRPGHM